MKDILSKTAKEHGVSLTDVRKEIDRAISIGMASDDEKTAELWKTVPRKGDVPTAEELIIWICTQLSK